jgi:hypothetical protein
VSPWKLAALLIAALAVGSPAVAAKREVRYGDDRLSVRLDQASLQDVLAEIARVSGAQVRGELLAPRDLTTEFEGVPMKEALERLLGSQNFTLTYADDGRLKVIELKALREEAIRRPAAPDPAAPDAGEPAYQRAAFEAFEGREQVPVDGKLAELFGSERVNWDLLANTAYGYQDAAVRRAAVRAAMRAIEGDAALRTALEDATRNVDSAQLADFARARCYNMAEDLVRNIARETDLPEVRTRATAVLRELKKAPYTGPIPHEFTKPRDG